MGTGGRRPCRSTWYPTDSGCAPAIDSQHPAVAPTPRACVVWYGEALP
jgi:hypothetical protein